MKYAVVEINGKQYKLNEDDVIEVEKMVGVKGDKINFEKILLFKEENDVKVGKPYINGVKVKAEILEQFQGEKIRVAKFKAKSRYRRVMGFRPQLTRIKIEKIISA